MPNPGVRITGDSLVNMMNRGRPFVMSFIADSLVAGYQNVSPMLADAVALMSGGKFVREIDKSLPAAFSGYTVDDLFNSARTALLPNAINTNPDVFVFELGTNSVVLPTWTAADQLEYEGQMRTALSLLAATGKPTLVLSVLPKGGTGNADPNGNVVAANVIRRRLAQEFGMMYVDTYASWGGVWAPYVIGDGSYTHPNASGVYLAATTILGALNALFPGRTGPILRAPANFANLGTAGVRGIIKADIYGAATWSDSPNGGSNTKTIQTDPSVWGNVYQAVSSAPTGATNTTHQFHLINTGSGFAVGDIVAFTMKVRAFGGTGTPALLVRSSFSGASALGIFDQLNPGTWPGATNGDTGWLDVLAIQKVPAGTTQARIQIQVAQQNGSAGAFGLTVQAAEPVFWNLTQMKMATRFGNIT